MINTKKKEEANYGGFYTTIENQVRDDGGKGLLYDHFTDYNAALAKLYTILAAAATSDLLYHSGHIMRSDGIITDGHIFDRRTVIEPKQEEDGNE